MKRYFTITLTLLAVCVCSCRKDAAKNPVVTPSPVCSSGDLVTLSYELRSLSSDKGISAKSIKEFLSRDEGRWKLHSDGGSFDYESFAYSSNDWNGIEVRAMFYWEESQARIENRDEPISELQIVVSDVSNPDRSLVIRILQGGLLCW